MEEPTPSAKQLGDGANTTVKSRCIDSLPAFVLLQLSEVVRRNEGFVNNKYVIK